MDITSYLLGKNASGGGGSATDYFNTSMNDIENQTLGYFGWLIKKIPPIETVEVTNLLNYFRWFKGDEILFSSTFNTKNVTNMTNMFFCCINITKLNLSMFNTENVTAMSSMFSGCGKCSEINVSSFNTQKVTNMSSMFNTCSALKTLDLSNFETNALTNIDRMFFGCTTLEHLDIRKFDFTTITSHTYTFGQNTSSYIPANCEIIVADNTQKQWLNSNFSRLTNVKTVAEYEG